MYYYSLNVWYFAKQIELEIILKDNIPTGICTCTEYSFTNIAVPGHT